MKKMYNQIFSAIVSLRSLQLFHYQSMIYLQDLSEFTRVFSCRLLLLNNLLNSLDHLKLSFV